MNYPRTNALASLLGVALFLTACSTFRTTSSTEDKKIGAVPISVEAPTVMEQALERNRLRNNQVPFSLSYDKAYRLQSETDFGGYGKAGDKPTHFNLKKQVVRFDDDATVDDVNAFLKKYGGSIIERRKLPASPDNTIPEKITNDYVVSFDYSKLDVDGFEELAKAWGLEGKYSFADEKSAKIYKLVMDVNQNRKKFKIKHIGLKPKMHQPGGLVNEGVIKDSSPATNAVSPTSPGFWFHGAYNSSSNLFGNRINYNTGSSYNAVWDKGYGVGVKVADIDSHFALTTESGVSGQLCGGTVWGYNCNDRNYNLNTATSQHNHGRSVASIIFSNPGDAKSNAGIASRAHAILMHTNGENFDYAIDVAVAWGAKILNYEWVFYAPSGDPYTWDIYTSIQNADNLNVIQIAATGNDGAQTSYPAYYSQVMGVSAHNKEGELSLYSSGWANKVGADVYAAGSAIYGADATAAPNIGVRELHGTSFAAPIVAGACALYVEQNKISNTYNARDKLIRDAWTRNDRFGNIMKIVDVYYGLNSY